MAPMQQSTENAYLTGGRMIEKKHYPLKYWLLRLELKIMPLDLTIINAAQNSALNQVTTTF